MKKLIYAMVVTLIGVLTNANAVEFICKIPKSCENFTAYSSGSVKNRTANYIVQVHCNTPKKHYVTIYENVTYKIKSSKDIRLDIQTIKSNLDGIKCKLLKK